MKTLTWPTLRRFSMSPLRPCALTMAAAVAFCLCPLPFSRSVAGQETPSALPAVEESPATGSASPTEASSPEASSPEASSPEADPTSKSASPPGEAGSDASSPESDAADGLRFAFSNAPWREVLNWLAEGADVALHINELPTGSFTYSDPRPFTPNEAIEQLNLFLIPEGYTIVRRGSLISVISLGDPRSMQQLDAMAELVSVDELDQRGEYDVVKCIIPLGEVSPGEATAELTTLTLMSEPAVLPNSNQLLITDTVGKIRSVLAILRSLTEPASDELTVRRFDLKYTDLENLLLAVGPHMGIEPNQRVGLDISISAGAEGKQLFVTGTEDKVKLLENLITMVDVPADGEDQGGQAILRSHAVSGENLQTVYDVLQTLLANQSIRLSMEPKTNSIVALAEPSIHDEIVQTIEELQAPAVEFAVVGLQKVDPYFAITLLNEMFNIPSEYDEDRDEDEPSNAPNIDADPENRRLFVRGTSAQIEQIKQVISSLNVGTPGSEQTRLIPMRGARAQQVLEAAKEFFKGDSRLQVLPPVGNLTDDVIERSLHPEDHDRPETQASPAGGGERSARDPSAEEDDAQEALRRSPLTAAQLTSTTTAEVPDSDEATSPSDVPVIRSQLMPQGIVIQSDDPQALDQFEDYLEQLSGGTGTMISQPVVFYLKYSKAEEAVRMLADMLDGAVSLTGVPGGSLVNGGAVSPMGSGYLGSLVYDREGATTVTAGSSTIVSDARLNRLIVQGTMEDVELIEGYLEIIDRGASLTSIETFGSSRVIDLVNTRAEEVAALVREAYVGRVASDSSGGQGQRGNQGNNNNQRDDNRNDSRRGDDQRRNPADRPTRGQPPEMTVAVHESSNSLVITAPDQLYREVEQLVKSIDQRAEQTVQVLPATDGGHLESVLMTLAGQEPPQDDRRDDRREDRRGDRSRD